MIIKPHLHSDVIFNQRLLVDNNLDKPIVFFDGHCVLCNGWVDFMLKRDKNSNLYYASLQGKTAQEQLLQQHRQTIDTIILKEGDQFHFQSSASLKAFSYLGGVYKLAKLFLIVPPFIRNFVYKIVSRNRYKWFGKNQTCRIPTEEEEIRFLP